MVARSVLWHSRRRRRDREPGDLVHGSPGPHVPGPFFREWSATGDAVDGDAERDHSLIEWNLGWREQDQRHLPVLYRDGVRIRPEHWPRQRERARERRHRAGLLHPRGAA